jgi:transcription antitermination factor NusG
VKSNNIFTFDFSGSSCPCDSEGEAVSTFQQAWGTANATPVMTEDNSHWYAVHTRARHEKMVVERLLEQGVSTYLPMVKETHRWSDRKKIVELPLFSCYVFARFTPRNEDRLRVCRTHGVLQVIGMQGEALPIPDEQIDAVRLLINEQLPWTAHPFLKIGQRVRICSGALKGVEGILVARNGDRTLVVSVDVIQRSLAVRIEGYQVEPV